MRGDRARDDVQAGRGLSERVAGDGASVVAAICSSFAEQSVFHWRGRRIARSRPHCSPRLLDAAAQEAICEARRHTGWGPRLVAGMTGYSHSTVWKVLHRHGLSRRPRAPREAANRYEWPCPGDLPHIDVKSYPRFDTPGHAVTGDRSRPGEHKRKRLGQDYAHAVVDDHSRLAFSEIYPDERAGSVVEFVEHALAFYARHGIRVQRILTDNAWAYTHNNALAELLARTRSNTGRSAPTAHAPTARSNASTRRWPANGDTASPTPPHATANTPCHTGSSTTTSAGHTAGSATGHRSAAFTTYIGRTSRSAFRSAP